MYKSFQLLRITDDKVCATKITLDDKELLKEDAKELFRSLPQWLQDWLRVWKNNTFPPDVSNWSRKLVTC